MKARDVGGGRPMWRFEFRVMWDQREEGGLRLGRGLSSNFDCVADW